MTGSGSGIEDCDIIDDEITLSEVENDQLISEALTANHSHSSVEIPKTENSIHLIYMQSIWSERLTGNTRISLVILIPSGFGECENDEIVKDDGLDLKVDGMELLLSLKWP